MPKHEHIFRFALAPAVAVALLGGCATHDAAKPRIAPDLPGATMFALAPGASWRPGGGLAIEQADPGNPETST